MFYKIILITLLACAAQDAAADKAVEVARITDRRISEASGIVASRRFPGVYWTHNDGDDNRLFAIRRDGSVIASATIDANLRDWEDIATDEEGNLYVADTGNNSGGRRHAVVLRLREPDPERLKGRKARKLRVEASWKMAYPGDPFDCESLLVWRGVFYLIAKSAAGVKAEIYRFDPSKDKTTMEKVATLPIDRPVTAADISPDGKELAVLTRGSLWVFEIDGEIGRAAQVQPRRIAVPPGQVEGCTFGDGEMLILAETGEIFAVPSKPPATTRP